MKTSSNFKYGTL